MVTPFDWQEGIGHRASFVESRLESGTPVLAVSLKEGVLAFTVRRQARKIFEVYDRLIFGAIGQQSDVEAMRVAALDFAHQEGFQRSEQDVTIQRVVSALSQPLKRAFSDFSMSPVVARSLFAEVGETPEQDRYYVLDYDGDFSARSGTAYVAGSSDMAEKIRAELRKLDLPKLSQADAIAELQRIWQVALSDEVSSNSYQEMTKDLTEEIVLLRRGTGREARFEILSEENVTS